MIKKIPAEISFRVVDKNITGSNESQARTFGWNDVLAEIDFYDGNINCEIELDLIEAMVLCFSNENLEINALTIIYNEKNYEVDVTRSEMFISNFSSVARNKVAISFSLLKSVLYLIPYVDERKNYLVFSGAHPDYFDMTVSHNGQDFYFSSPKDCDLLMVSSDSEFSKDDRKLIILSFSLYQNAELKLLESHTQNKFMLYIQLPPPVGTRICTDKNIFPLIWQWLANDDNFLYQQNILDFFFAGARNRGSYLDFRFINLLVCMNSICGRSGQFGVNISNHFGISEGDGHWLAYVRNHMMHAGASISEAITGAFADFAKKQSPRGLKLSRYSAYKVVTVQNELPFALYCDVIDLLMAYFMKMIGYAKSITQISAIYGVVVN